MRKYGRFLPFFEHFGPFFAGFCRFLSIFACF